MSSGKQPYLSLVAASRNDDHGGDPLRRTQIFINSFLTQCEKFRLPAELILVDWNPPAGKRKLHEVLDFSRVGEHCSVRVIQVPPEIHQGFDYGDRLPFFQMIAKNAGIRRALGEFVLATNIDILLSDELMEYVASRKLDPSRTYRVDRYDVDNQIALDAPLEEQLRFCWEHIIRINALQYTGPLKSSMAPAAQQGLDLQRKKRDGTFHRGSSDGPEGSWTTLQDAPNDQLHTNACGDFTLLAKDKWMLLGGYPEFHVFSFHLDSLFCFMAHYHGILETVLAVPCVCFHIEHSIGSGWTPEGQQTLFARLEKLGIPSLDFGLLIDLAESMRAQRKAFRFNDQNWGLEQVRLEETVHSKEREPVSIRPEVPAPDRSHGTMRMNSVVPEFDFFKLQAAYLRQENVRLTADLEQARSLLAKGLKGFLEAWWNRSSARWIRSYNKRAQKMKKILQPTKERESL